MTLQDTQCPHCGAGNPTGSAACQDCGNVLSTVVPQPGPAWVPTTPAAPAGGPSAAPSATGAPSVSITVERSGRTVLQATLAKDSILVGRADVDDSGLPMIPDIDLADCDPDRLVSRRHLRLLAGGSGILAEDLGSGNGSFVEYLGQLKPGEPTPIQAGARIMLGRGGIVLTARV